MFVDEYRKGASFLTLKRLIKIVTRIYWNNTYVQKISEILFENIFYTLDFIKNITC